MPGGENIRSVEEIDVLIAFHVENPFLWNTRLKDHSNKMIRKRAYAILCSQLGEKFSGLLCSLLLVYFHPYLHLSHCHTEVSARLLSSQWRAWLNGRWCERARLNFEKSSVGI